MALAMRASAGCESHLRSLQPLALMVANGLFVGGHLVEDGKVADSDWQTLSDLGFEREALAVRKFHAAAFAAAER